MATCRDCGDGFSPTYGTCEACGGDGETEQARVTPCEVYAAQSVHALGDLSILFGRSMVSGILQNTELLECAVDALVTLAHCAGIPEETILSHFDVYPASDYAKKRMAELLATNEETP